MSSFLNKSILIIPLLAVFSIISLLYSCSEVSSRSKQNNDNNIEQVQTDLIQNNDSIPEEYYDISKDYLLGKTDPVKDSLLVEVPAKYCLIRKEYMHKDAVEDFIAMYEAAAKEGISLKIISAHRTFQVQKWLWDQKYYKSDNPLETVKKVLKYNAMPGTSRHHWGTDIDILSVKLEYFETAEGKRSYKWLLDNAGKFGFYQPYTPNRETGYNEEKWHWSYISVAKELQKQYRKKITYEDFSGFNGCETAKELNVIENYVFGIDEIFLK